MKTELTELGLSQGEIDLYFALLKLGEATIAGCIKITDLPRTSAYVSMRRLVDCGLVAELPGKPIRFAALNPTIALEEYLSGRRKELKNKLSNEIEAFRRELNTREDFLENGLESYGHSILTEAVSLYNKPDEAVENGKDIVVLKGIKSAMDAMRSVDLQKRLRVLSRPPVLQKFDEKYEIKQMETLKEAGCRLDSLIEESICENPDIRKLLKIYLRYGQEIRMIPSVPAKMSIYDNTAAFFLLEKLEDPANAVFIQINNPSMVQVLTFAWEFLWSQGRPLTLEELK